MENRGHSATEGKEKASEKTESTESGDKEPEEEGGSGDSDQGEESTAQVRKISGFCWENVTKRSLFREMKLMISRMMRRPVMFRSI